MSSLPRTFVESALPSKADFEASLSLPDEERLALELQYASLGNVAAVSGAAPVPVPAGPPLAAPAAARAAAATSAAASSSHSASSEHSAAQQRPIAVLIIGMAGSGKTTLMQRLNAHLHAQKTPYYMVNLDPAVLETPFGAHIDIRDTVNYREVMKQYNLGPNGGILTALNLFATRFEQVLSLIGKRVAGPTPPRYALFDTPGQIEIFTWSASGQIITESLAATYPTAIVYVVDTPRCSNAVTFMSNMLYACSILYKLKLPLILAFNKTDTASAETPLGWMSDLDSFQEALQSERSYMGSLAQSMALMLEEFYTKLTAVSVSALTGDGMDEFFAALDGAAAEYDAGYAVELTKAREARAAAEAEREARERERMAADGLVAAGATVLVDGTRHRGEPSTAAADEDEGPDEGGESDDEHQGVYSGGVGYNADDEKWARDNHDNDKEEYESLMRYLQRKPEDRP